VDPLSKPEWRAGVGQVLGTSLTPYTPTLFAATTNPTGFTCRGWWCQVGPLVYVRYRLDAGTGMTAGSGAYRMSVPVKAASIDYDPIPAGSCWAASGASAHSTFLHWFPFAWGGNFIQWTSGVSGTGADLGAAVPFAWVAGAQVRGAFTYEAATI
jgi:hypothetical protein